MNPELKKYIEKQDRDVQELIKQSLRKLRMPKLNERRYQEFLACQKFKFINSEINRNVTSCDIEIDLKVVGYYFESNEYIPAYLLHIYISKFGGTVLGTSSITAAQ